MKKIISLLLVATLVLSFSACGKGNTEETNNNTNETQSSEQTTIQTAKLFFDESKYTAKKDEPKESVDDLYFVSTTYTLNEKTTYELSKKVIVDSMKINCGETSINELVNSGWSFITTPAAEDEVAANSIALNCKVKNANGQVFLFYMRNNTNKPQKASNCVITYLDISCGDNNAPDFTYVDSINDSSTPTDIIQKLGNPSNISISEFYNKNDEFQYYTARITYSNSNSEDLTFHFTIKGEDIKMDQASFDFS